MQKDKMAYNALLKYISETGLNTTPEKLLADMKNQVNNKNLIGINATPTLNPNELFKGLTNMITLTIVNRELEFENPFLKLFNNLQEKLGDTYRFITSGLGTVEDFDPTKRVNDKNYFLQSYEQYFESVNKKVSKMTLLDSILKRAFQSMTSLGSELTNFFQGFMDTLEFKYTLPYSEKVLKDDITTVAERVENLPAKDAGETDKDYLKRLLSKVYRNCLEATWITTYADETTITPNGGCKWFVASEVNKDGFRNYIAVPLSSQKLIFDFDTITGLKFNVDTVFFNSQLINLNTLFGDVITAKMTNIQPADNKKVFCIAVSPKLLWNVYQLKEITTQYWASILGTDYFYHYWNVMFADKSKYGVAYILPENTVLNINEKEAREAMDEVSNEIKNEIKRNRNRSVKEEVQNAEVKEEVKEEVK